MSSGGGESLVSPRSWKLKQGKLKLSQMQKTLQFHDSKCFLCVLHACIAKAGTSQSKNKRTNRIYNIVSKVVSTIKPALKLKQIH